MADDWVERPFTEARNYLRGLRPTPKAVYDQMELDERDEAFTVANVTKMEVLQEMLDDMQDSFDKGESIEDFVAKFEKTGLSAGHLETVYRTNMQIAYGRGLWDQGTDSDIADAIWGWRYRTVGDDRVRPEHQELDGEVFATDDPDGQRVFPPWDFNCRCSAEWITTVEAEDAGFESSDLPEGVQVALGETDFVSPAFKAEYEPDLSGYDAGLVGEYVDAQAE